MSSHPLSLSDDEEKELAGCATESTDDELENGEGSVPMLVEIAVDDGLDIPVIELPEQCADSEDFQLAEVFLDPLDATDEHSVAHASLVPSLNDIDSIGDLSHIFSFASNRNERPEFVGAMLHKTTVNSIGVRFRMDSGNKITRVVEDSLIAESPLQVGDKVISINGKTCENFSAKETSQLIKRQFQGSKQRGSHLYMIAHNEGGMSDLIEFMIMKKTPQQSLGVSVIGHLGGYAKVSQISPDGIFARSLFNVGDQLLKINGRSCLQMSTEEVVSMLRRESCLTILARTRQGTAFVVAEMSGRNLHLHNSNINTTGRPIFEPVPEHVIRHSKYFRNLTFIIFFTMLAIVGVVLWRVAENFGTGDD